jgi:hypothetical protein
MSNPLMMEEVFEALPLRVLEETSTKGV